jgi:hypothetical protein
MSCSYTSVEGVVAAVVVAGIFVPASIEVDIALPISVILAVTMVEAVAATDATFSKATFPYAFPEIFRVCTNARVKESTFTKTLLLFSFSRALASKDLVA